VPRAYVDRDPNRLQQYLDWAVRVVDLECGLRLRREMGVVSVDGRPLGPSDVTMVRGPTGASTHTRLAARKKLVETARCATPAPDRSDDNARDARKLQRVLAPVN
jgi:hypothetical protein